MANIWQETREGTHYQVRNAGKTLRLYTDNVLHSQYNPQKKLTGSVWDLLFLPVLCLEKTRPLRVLVLGVGGGAVMQMLNEFFHCEKITGIEMNATHIEIAKKYFNLNGKNIELVEADALTWVKNNSTRNNNEKFDIIIDDLFYEEDGEPMKVAAPNATWFYQLYSLLMPKGLLVMNFVGRRSAMSSAPIHDDEVSKLLPYGLHLTTPHYDNHVLAFSSEKLPAGNIRKAINRHEKLKLLKNNLRFSCRSL
ncbi:MAG: methyltransferase domain-containing protein [Oleispira sp.]|nr:methyltransferase domain-containing protein [Oleispira sp.]